MKNKIKGFITVILSLIILVEMATLSQAAEVDYNEIDGIRNAKSGAIGKTIGTIGRGFYDDHTTPYNENDINLEGNNRSKYLYCLQKRVVLGNTNTYKVKKYIEIDGNTAKVYSSQDNYTTVTTGTNYENYIFAYILGANSPDNDKGYGYGGLYNQTSKTQDAIWTYWNTWAGSIGIYEEYGTTGYQDWNNSLLNDAKNIATEYKNASTPVKAEIEALTKTVDAVSTSDNKQLIGPIKLNFKGTLSLTNSGNFEFYNAGKVLMSNGIKDVKSGEAFYIKTDKKDNDFKLYFKVQTNSNEQLQVNAKIWILEHPTDKRQRLMIAEGSTTIGGGPSEATLEINAKNQDEGNLTIVKKDMTTQENLTGAKFKIQIASTGNWLGIHSRTQEYIYTSSEASAHEFEVDENGKLEINGLATKINKTENGKTTKVETYVKIYETKAPDGYTLSEQTGYEEEHNRVFCNEKEYKIKKDTNVSITIGNKNTGSLKIIKKDEANGKTLAGAGFKISVNAEGDKNKSIWLKQVSEDPLKFNYTSNFKEATTFTTEKNGTTYVKGLSKNNVYRIYEVAAPEKYSLEKQDDYDENNKWVRCKVKETGLYTINIETRKTATVTFENQKEPGNLIIIKKDSSSSMKLSGAGFKISVNVEGNQNKNTWLKQVSEDPIEYNFTSNFKDATTFTTGDKGTTVVEGLLKNNVYYIYEIQAPTRYTLEIQDDYDKDNNWVRCKDTATNSYKIEIEKTATVTFENKGEPGNLEIVKKDSSSSMKLSGAGFKISVNAEGNKNKNKWLKRNNDGTYDYTSSFKDATTFTTGDKGTTVVEGLLKNNVYYIYEVESPDKYPLEKQDDYDKDNKWVRCKDTATNSYKIEIEKTATVTFENKGEPGNLEIVKKDSSSSMKLSGAGFKISVNVEGNKAGITWLKRNNDGTYDYTSNFKDATTFTTGDKGTTVVEGLLKNNVYYIYEVQAPTRYKLEIQDDYDKDNNWVRCKDIGTNSYKIEIEKTATVTFENKGEPGNLEIVKKDSSSSMKLSGAGFKISVNAEGNKAGSTWLKRNNDGTYDYTSSFKDATTFTTGTEGTTVVEGLLKNNVYYIYEVQSPDKYPLEKQNDYDKDNNWVRCKDIGTNSYKIEIEKTATVTFENEGEPGNLEIIKKDKTTGKALAGAKFKISVAKAGTNNKQENIWLKRKDDGTYSYTEKFETATTFIADKDGKIKIDNLEEQRYFIYETKAPAGYDITSQIQYDSNEGWVACGSTLVKVSETVQVPLTNTEYIAIEGYVWIDKLLSKSNTYNDAYDNGQEDIITDKVTITLRNKLNNEIVAQNPKIITKNIKNGDAEANILCYRFEKIDYNMLKDYYVSFYSEEYSQYITVTPDFGKTYGSKALLYDVAEYDKDFKGMATLYDNEKIGMSTYREQKDEAKYGLSGLANTFYNEDTYTLENINLGIKPIHDPDYDVFNTLAFAEITLKGYSYTYYLGLNGPEAVNVPMVRIQSDSNPKNYSSAIYPADIKFESENKADELKMYVSYRIQVTNSEQLDDMYVYQEQYLNVKEVIDSFDSDRYELADENWILKEGTDNVAIMKENYLKDIFYNKDGKGIENNSFVNRNTNSPYNVRYAYIRLQVKENKLKELLTLGEGKEVREKEATIASVKAYHEYTRIDSSWKNSSEKNTITNTDRHYSIEKQKQERAAFLSLKLGQNRTISGKVFEDSKDNSRPNELIGDGKYDNENLVKGVKVELGNYDGDTFTVTNLYQLNDKEETFNKAETYTSSNGEYSFVGVVPGEYFIRFTYGDGSQTIVNAKGEEIKKVSSDNYKSTIVTNEVRDAFVKYEGQRSAYSQEAKTGTATWYMNLENHNIAIDDLNIRKQLSENKYEVNALTSKLNTNSKNIIAETPVISIPIEFKEGTVGESNQSYPNEIKTLNFGIIEMPKIRIDINKKITYIRLAQEGSTILEGNPGTQNIAYVTDLDKNTEGGSKYVKMELESTMIEAKPDLYIQYQIEVVNNSDLDYEGEDYYKYGDKTNAKEKTVQISKVYDYLDSKISYKSKEGTPNVKVIEKISQYENKAEAQIPDELRQAVAMVKDVKDEYSKPIDAILEISEFGDLVSSKSENNSEKSKGIVTINAHKQLSSDEEDLEYINIAEVITIKTTSIAPANVEFLDSQEGLKIAKTKKVTLTITPSTGEDRSMIYFIAGTIALLVTAGGITLIRKNSKK